MQRHEIEIISIRPSNLFTYLWACVTGAILGLSLLNREFMNHSPIYKRVGLAVSMLLYSSPNDRVRFST